MCGIAGLVVNKAAGFDPRTVIERTQSKLLHRGPDDRGVFISDDGHCTLVHTRLSILDLSFAGHQPMGLGEQGAWSKEQSAKSTGQSGKSKGQSARFWITYNGEIYNYLQLREELGARSGESQRSEVRDQRSEANSQRSEDRYRRSEISGNPSAISYQPSAIGQFPWHSNSDTEVILSAYAKWGRDCMQRLRGMFAFGLWDEQQQELFLARDPFGIKQLYYYQTDHLFLFASEVRALLATGLVPRKLDRQGVASYLQFGSVQDPLTIIDGVQSLLPGHCLVVKTEDRRLRTELFCYYTNLLNQIDDGVPASRLTPHGNPDSRPQAVKLLRSKLEDSVRQHLVSDVPVGAFLSGGIDSSAIVALMSRVADQKPKTFNVVFKESEFSEAAHARLVAKKFGTEHQEIMLSEDRLLGMLPDALAALDQPTMDGINTYVVSKAVKESGITVALSGLGGDELFAGYPSFRRAAALHRLAMTPSPIRRLGSLAGRAILNGSARRQKFWDLVASDCSPYAAYAISRQLFAPSEICALLTDFRSPTSDLWPQAPRSTLHAGSSMPFALSPLQHQDVINEVSRLELSGYMANTLLRDTDQMSMAHALEVRVPFIDPVVVSFVLGLPGEWKTDGSRPKPLLLDAIGDLLPEEVWRRPKMGFTLPFERWMQSGLRSEVAAALSSSSDLPRLGLSKDSVGAIWEAFAKNPSQEPWSRPWALYVLTKWCELNRVAA
jgi:asparagine synthase (glutamine-hydrolysing)